MSGEMTMLEKAARAAEEAADYSAGDREWDRVGNWPEVARAVLLAVRDVDPKEASKLFVGARGIRIQLAYQMIIDHILEGKS